LGSRAQKLPIRGSEDTVTVITAREGDRLCRKWIPVGEAVFELAARLEQCGFAAFLPSLRFDEQFCEGSAENDLWRRCIVERAMQRLGRPAPLRKDFGEPASFYQSPLLAELERARDLDNGVRVGELPARYPGEIWRRHAEPCARRQAQASMQRQPWFDEQAAAVVREKRAILSAELRARGVTPEVMHGQSGSDEEPRYQCFLDVSTAVLESHGFKSDGRRSREFHPVLSKELTTEWDICWTPGDHQRFAGILDKGYFTPTMELRHRSFVARINNDPKQQGRFLFVPYQDLIPGFSRAYWEFNSLALLEHCIRAHLEIYRIIGPRIEQGVLEWASNSDAAPG
jgi:hypothetical protein